MEGASHRMLLRMNSEPFLSIGLLTMSAWCVELCPEGSISLLHSLCSSVSVCSRSLLQHTRFSSEIKTVIAGAKWYATKWLRTPWLLSKSSALSSCSPWDRSQGKANLLRCERQPCWLVRQLRIEGNCFSNSLYRHNSVDALLVV